MVGIVLVRENVHKHLSVGFEKPADLLEQVVVVFHVFKHCAQSIEAKNNSSS